jgi:Na+-driven multidrug efflux pump
VFGLPFAYILAFKFKLGAVGLWAGLTGTAGLQALLNLLIVYRYAEYH